MTNLALILTCTAFFNNGSQVSTMNFKTDANGTYEGRFAQTFLLQVKPEGKFLAMKVTSQNDHVDLNLQTVVNWPQQGQKSEMTAGLSSGTFFLSCSAK